MISELTVNEIRQLDQLTMNVNVLLIVKHFFLFVQIRHIRQQEGSNSHAVQQGEVSSSNPNILSNDQVGPILLEV